METAIPNNNLRIRIEENENSLNALHFLTLYSDAGEIHAMSYVEFTVLVIWIGNKYVSAL